ncbi:hypothetical protein WA158_008318 [Blastocystis sp. Blastoise]
MATKEKKVYAIPILSKISRDCILEGDITIGKFVVVHPRVQIKAIGGPIIIGDRTIIEDKCKIVCPEGCPGMNIGKFNSLHVGTRIEGCELIGDANEFGAGCFIGPNTKTIGSGCKIAPKTHVEGDIADNTSVSAVGDSIVTVSNDFSEDNKTKLKAYSDLTLPIFERAFPIRKK